MTKAFYPRRKFRSISITGYSCQLNCEMCRGRYLRGMIPAPSPFLLGKMMEGEMKKGVIGFLISGGFNERGVLPFRPFLNEISEARKRGAIISIHPGLVNEEESSLLRESVDIVDFELISGKAAYIKGGNPDLYEKSFKALMERGPRIIIPHVIIGMPFSSFEDFKHSVDLSYEYGAEELVVLVFIPTPGTAFHNLTPSLELIKKCISYARRRSDILSLGCMRPNNMKKDIDRIAFEEGVDRIVLPSINSDFQLFDACCSVPENMLYLFKKD
ncbi:MAG: hypothetical protein ACP5LQ_02490 [Candidatus Methanodesulfokora sp.]